LFAGVSLEGSTLRSDGGANENLYGKKLDARDIVQGGKVGTPAAGKALIGVLSQKSAKRAK